MNKFRFPGNTDRTVVFGRTGSGKTVFLTWLLSLSSIDTMPWIIFDYKDDAYLKSIPRIKAIKLGVIPREPGIYIIKLDAGDNSLVENYLHDILKKGNIGIFCDEGASIPQSEPKFRALKTVFAQGRSKHVPVLFGSQRPPWINRSVRSEGEFYAAFHLSNASDRKIAREFMPENVESPLGPYQCHWYDVKNDRYFLLDAVAIDDIMARFERRLRPNVRFI